MTTPPALAAYRLATTALQPLAPAFLRRRARRGREDAARLAERLGHASAERPPGRLAWLHGVSVGESVSLLPIATRLREARPDAAILITSGTRAAAEVLGLRLPSGAIHQFAPVDVPSAVRCFLDHWRPDLAVFAESELWPNLLCDARARGVRLALVGARQSDASLRRWRRAPATAQTLFGAFDLIFARDEAAAAGLAGLGARVDGRADPKLAAAPLPCEGLALEQERAALAGRRPVILAASTHPGEEAAILAAWARLADRGRALLAIAPRHVERAPAIAEMIAAGAWRLGRRSRADEPAGAEVYLVDVLGELGLWYRLADLAVLGGSLRPGVGGHNPLEPARLGCPVASGGFVENSPIVGEMAAAGALTLVDSDAALAALLGRALADPAAFAEQAGAAGAFAAGRAADTFATLDRVVDLLPP